MYLMHDGEADEEEEADIVGLDEVLSQEPAFLALKAEVLERVAVGYLSVQAYMKVFEPFLDGFIRNRAYQASVATTLSGAAVTSFTSDIKVYREQAESFELIPPPAHVGVYIGRAAFRESVWQYV